MTWTFDQTFTTASSQGRRNALRSLIRDTDSARQLLSDEELAFYFAQENNLYRAAAAACSALADSRAVDKSVGDLSISNSVLPTNYLALAKLYRSQADLRGGMPYAGGISQADKLSQEEDSDRVVPIFLKDLHRDDDVTIRRST